MRGAVVAAIAVALAATSVYAGPEPVQTVLSLRAKSWNLQITARRPVMRAQGSQSELKTRTPVAKQFCAVSSQVGFAQPLCVAGSPTQRLSRSLLLRGHSFSPSRAPPSI
jgi:hypothetical protein